MKIYTKTGDKGTTSLLGGSRLLKSETRIHAYGTVDELNSYVGLLRDLEANKERGEVLREIQDRLFTIGSHLAVESKETKINLPEILDDDVELLEKEIDKMNEELPEMKSFILPGGHIAVSHTHIARCVCRRAERWVIALDQQEPIDERIVKYLNRLSDFLFVLARKIGQELGVNDTPWQARIS